MNAKLSTKAIHFRLLNLSSALGLAAFLLGGAEARATSYAGNGSTDWGGCIGQGTLTLTDDATNIYATLALGNGETGFCGGNNGLVIYIDTGAGGGFSDTSGFNDQLYANQVIISGVQGSGRSVMTFMTGFRPQYAISMIGGYCGLYKLADGGNGSMTWEGDLNVSASAPYTFSFPASAMGLTPGSKATINMFGSLISGTAYRSKEAIPGNDNATEGEGNLPFTQTAFAPYVFDAGAPTLTPVSFRVDMTAMITNGYFNPPPGGTDVVNAAGTFQSSPWSGFALTNGTGTNINIYSGTYEDANLTGTAEQYKFNINQVSWEGSDDRLFTLQSGGQTTPLVYFADLTPVPSATTNLVTFQIDLTPWIALGNFTNVTDSVEVRGTFDQFYNASDSPPEQWAPGILILTNNPNGSNVNLYSGTFSDGNYPGTWEQYKFVITQGGNANYESIANRDFTTPTNAGTFPVAYFNNISNVVSVPVTFQVDMTSQIEAGNVNLGAGNTVGVAGSFQNPAWSGATLTNNADAANTNIFSGTIVISQEPGYVFDYKFIYTSGGSNTYESPASMDGNNRVFVLTPPAQTLPLVFWSDEDPNNVLPEATEVTFTVNMTNAVDEYGIPFNPSTDDVMINGSFLQPGGWINALWADDYPSYDYPAETMNEEGLSLLYSQTFLVPAGSPLQVSYKYGIYHGASSLTENTNCDNEAPVDDNHSRYIRTVGTYSFPLDVFGQQTNSNPAIAAEANEISFGGLAAISPSPGTIALTWLGRPGVFLQTSTNLASGVWTTVTNSGGGISASNVPASGSNMFFRLVNP
jgi:hypothetical protein